MKWLIDLVKVLGDLPNTFWGIIVLLLSMRIAIHYNADIGYYFAGVGSTLLGINHLQQQPNKTTATFTADPAQLKVTQNASDTPSQD